MLWVTSDVAPSPIIFINAAGISRPFSRFILGQQCTQNSGIAEHAYSAHHDIDWESVHILDQESDFHRRLVRESLHIRSARPSMNRENGLEIPGVFMKIIDEGATSDVTHHTVTSHPLSTCILNRAEDGQVPTQEQRNHHDW